MKKIMTFVLLAIAMTGCGNKKDDKLPVNQSARQVRGDGTVGTVAPSSHDILLNGQVFGDDFYSFYDSVVGLLSATTDPQYIGQNISHQPNGQTGVWIGGQVQLQSGRLTPMTHMPRTNIATNSRLLIMVWDEYAGQRDDQGQEIPAIPVYLTSSQGTIEGNRASLGFSDEYGGITMEGTFDSTYFYGTIWYSNSTSFDGSMGRSGTLGTFVISTCSFFQCN